MKVAVFGAGALGSVYGVRLALHGDVDVSFVVRPARVAARDPIAIEKVRGNVLETLSEPSLADHVKGDIDAIILAVGTEDLEALKVPLGTSTAPIVILTPMLPKEWARVRAALGDRAFAAMPNVVAYARKGAGDRESVVRYWLPPAATKIDEPRRGSPHEDVLRALTAALSKAGIRAKLEMAVHEINPASTVCFIPIGMAFAIAGSIDALLRDENLVNLTMAACRDGVRLSHRIGKAEPWARLSPILSAPWALNAWLSAAGRLSPEALRYAEEHFGRKLREQHRVMIREMIELAREKALPHEAFDELRARLD